MQQRELIYWWWFPFVLLCVIAFVLQLNSFIHMDVIYLIHAAERMLSGGNYTRGFFETNPPMIMFLYMPAIFLSKLSGMSLIYTLRIYLFILMISSISTCYFFISKIIKTDSTLKYSLLYLLCFILFFLPVHEAAQREHMLLILVLPYLFLCVLRVEDRTVSPYLAAFVGLFAGLGFAIKPFFLPTFFLVEFYVMFKKRNFLWALRIESLMISCVILIYLFCVVYFYSDYFRIVLPIVLHLYFLGNADSWMAFFENVTTLFCFAAIIAYFLLKKADRNSSLTCILWLATIGFTISFTIPRSAWYYHVLPAFGMASLLFGVLFVQMIFPTKDSDYVINKMNKLYLIVVAGIIFYIPLLMSTYYFDLAITARYDSAAKTYLNFFNKTGNHNTYMCFSQSNDFIFPIIYGNANYVGYYSFFWWRHGIDILEKSQDPAVIAQLEKDKNFLVNLIVDNINYEKPRFILVDILKDEKGFQHRHFIKEFSQYDNFRKTWQKYHYLNTIGRFKIYEINQR